MKHLERALELIDAASLNHNRMALQFSGGKDSLALLHLMKPWWPRLIVLWGNPGDEFPETVAQMQQVKREVWQFHEIRGNADKEKAYPVDILPLRATEVGRAIEPEGATITLQSKFDCCWRNFWGPMSAKVKQLGVTVVFRGQRLSETLRAPIKHGSCDPSGASICLPLEDWTQTQVVDYLKSQNIELPKFYETMSAGPKCMHCTAWVEDQRGKQAYLAEFHPEVAAEVNRRNRLIAEELNHGIYQMRMSLSEATNPIRNPLERAHG